MRVLSLARAAGCPMYIPHITAWEVLDVVRMVQGWGGQRIFAETCTHYLTLTDAEMTRRGSLAKVGPPLRGERDVEAMWEALNDGLIDVVGSDSGGVMVAKKEPLFDEVFKAPFGFPGLSTMFSVAYDEGINKGRTSLPDLVRVMAERPARIFGLYPQKGVLEPGSDADVVVFDPTVAHTVRAENQHLNIDYTMFEGRECVGAPVAVVQRGAVLLEDGALKAKPGQGKFLVRQTLSDAV